MRPDGEDIEMEGAAPELQASQRFAEAENVDEKYPNRPRNTKPTFAFHELYQTLFEPLISITKKKAGAGSGWGGQRNIKPQEQRRMILERFIARWREEVGNDIYPAFRLIMPDKDRDRTVYGLKEKFIGKILVKVMKIDKNSEDGNAMINWKNPGVRSTGDFAGRCYEIIKKRPLRTSPGNLTIQQVNEKLDELAGTTKEENQLPVLRYFYEQMNPDELLWLIRIILKQMKIGATEKSIFDAWHPDAESLFNISSSLKRVCWELFDPEFRLDGDTKGVVLMSCFQPQLANFQKRDLLSVKKAMRQETDDDVFWIEEKLDGERMQLHMDHGQFKFWSRKAKEYTYLYGSSFEDGSLTRFIKNAFHKDAKSIILDGEMISWDPVVNAVVAFGYLKSAALAQDKNPDDSTCHRPVFKIFDILYLNGESLTNFSLEDRHKALKKVIEPVNLRMEIHEHTEAKDVAAIEQELRKVVDTGSEGLVVKNPRSVYRLNDRNDDWIKVKPEYMTEFGEEFDLLVIGAYWGGGRRGGIRSSYLCGLRVDENTPGGSPNAEKFWSFCKVGGGFTAQDYSAIAHKTEGKWKEWDESNPPLEFIELAGIDHQQHERPDQWIRPSDSFIVSVKAAQVTASNMFRVQKTLRFPRFKGFKWERKWEDALTITGFTTLRDEIMEKQKEKKIEVEKRKTRVTKRRKRELVVVGANEGVVEPFAGPKTDLFEGYSFLIASDAVKPEKKSKAELEQLVKAHGGRIFQNENAAPDIKIIADRNTVKVASLRRKGGKDIIRPSWILDCIRVHEEDHKAGRRGSYVLPLEPAYMLHALPETAEFTKDAVDEYGDSFARSVTVDDLKQILDNVPEDEIDLDEADTVRDQLLENHPEEFEETPGWIFHNSLIYLDTVNSAVKNKLEPFNPQRGIRQWPILLAEELVEFGGGSVTDNFHDLDITQIVVGDDKRRIQSMRSMLKWKTKIPRIVSTAWIEESIKAGTLLDEERFVVK